MSKERYPRARIESVGSYLPSTIVTTADLEESLQSDNPDIRLPKGAITRLIGVHNRRRADDNEQASDLATKAAEVALQRAEAQSGITRDMIGLLIFAAIGHDSVEPATANYVQRNLGLRCTGFDLSNACNSFFTGIDEAESNILSGKRDYVLVVSGELPSRVARTKLSGVEQLRESFASYTMGDAGAAMVLGPSDDERGII